MVNSENKVLPLSFFKEVTSLKTTCLDYVSSNGCDVDTSEKLLRRDRWTTQVPLPGYSPLTSEGRKTWKFLKG